MWYIPTMEEHGHHWNNYYFKNTYMVTQEKLRHNVNSRKQATKNCMLSVRIYMQNTMHAWEHPNIVGIGLGRQNYEGFVLSIFKLPITLQKAASETKSTWICPRRWREGQGMKWGGMEGRSWPLLQVVAGFHEAPPETIWNHLQDCLCVGQSGSSYQRQLRPTGR